MIPLVIPYPEIDPVLVQLGPLAIRWYALAYIAGLVIGWQVIRRLCEQSPKVMTPVKIDDFLLWAALGVILGGRLGYVLFYKPGFYLANPLAILTLWEGGMSFHGGFLGVIVATIVFSLRNKTDPFLLGDLLAIVSPIGLFFGRLANFINGELWGRVSDVPWAMVFPHAGPEPRHPSQLYQAGLEGLALFALLMALVFNPAIRARRGFVSGAFLAGYGAARLVGELFRQPDAHLGFLVAGVTMGQVLSLPMILVGGWLMLRAKPSEASSEATDGARPPAPGRPAG
jgi:phosphatidylglycerol---prolipoprotein diacylglyceryl transferase